MPMPEPIYQHGSGISQQIEMESLSKSVCPRRIEHKVPKFTFSRLFSQELTEEWLNIIYSDHDRTKKKYAHNLSYMMSTYCNEPLWSHSDDKFDVKLLPCDWLDKQ